MSFWCHKSTDDPLLIRIGHYYAENKRLTITPIKMEATELRMPIKTRTLTLLAIGLATFGTNSVVFAQDLKVGSKAPELKVSGWVKGKEVKKFESGKIYVVEFWATWCGPCRESIPHLTEMAKGNKDVTFIGIDSFERPADNLDAVKKFVADMGAKMDYNVAVDGSAAFMAKNWMEASGSQGIPTAFIVDKTGTVAWIGHPMEMEEPLAKVKAGNMDVKAEADRREQEQRTAKVVQDHMAKMTDLMQKGQTKDAIKEFDAMFKEAPQLEKQLGATKFEMMAQVGDPGTNDYAKYLFEKVLGDDAINLNQVAWFMVDDETGFKGADLDLALKISLKSNELTKEKDASLMDTLGYVYFKKGDLDKAIEVQEKAVKLAEKDPKVDAQTREELKDRLAKFKKAKGGGN